MRSPYSNRGALANRFTEPRSRSIHTQTKIAMPRKESQQHRSNKSRELRCPRYQSVQHRQFIVLNSIETAAGFVLSYAAPLLEEERYACTLALIAHRLDP
jgi:hypothetical protein